MYTRKIGGKRYNLAYTRESNTAAQADARSARKQGFLVRVIPRTMKLEGRRAYHFFDVYVHDGRLMRVFLTGKTKVGR